jgi:hypothetical protein
MTQLQSGTAGNVAGGERLSLSCLNTSSGVLGQGFSPFASDLHPRTRPLYGGRRHGGTHGVVCVSQLRVKALADDAVSA